ncbi:MAG: hypothetical protein Cons2KO_13450 [Congregibacter sp.]
MINALFSIHDVMPETLGEVEGILKDFRRRKLPLPALLVVPGRRWTSKQTERLQRLELEGAELIAHGWVHQTTPKTLSHRLHAAVISRNVAEHLAYDEAGVTALMQRSHDWFAQNGLAAPSTYIPPAWALGIRPDRLLDTPYSVIEVLGGALRRSGADFSLQRLPLLGFEADTWPRAVFLRIWNQQHELTARRNGTPLRISIHPYDKQLRLAGELTAVLDKRWRHLRYADLAYANADVCAKL